MKNDNSETRLRSACFKSFHHNQGMMYDHGAINDYRRYVLLRTSLMLIALICFGYSFINFKRGVMALALVEVTLIPVCISLFFMVRYIKYFNLVRIIFTVMVCFFGLSAATVSGTYPTIFVWNALIPVFGFFLWEKKGGLIISMTILPAAVFLYFRYHMSGADSMPLPALSNIISYVVVVAVFTFYYEITRAETEEALKKEINARRQAEEGKGKLIAKLQKALVEVETLSGLLPICASCKKIRDDQGYWNQIEVFLQQHSNARFSHGICPECEKKLYGDQEWYKELHRDSGDSGTSF